MPIFLLAAVVFAQTPAVAVDTAAEAAPEVQVDALQAAEAQLTAEPKPEAVACLAEADRLLRDGSNDTAKLARLYRLRGACALLQNDATRAEREFTIALTFDPAVAVVEHPAFARARTHVPAHVFVVRADHKDGDYRVMLDSDAFLLVEHGAIYGADGAELARFPIDVGHRIHRVTTTPVADAHVVLLDKFGNTLGQAPITTRAVTANAPPPTPIGIVTYVGAAALGTGIVTTVVSSVAVGIVSRKDVQAEATEGDVLRSVPVWLGGIAVGAALFVVGSALVIADQGFESGSP